MKILYTIFGIYVANTCFVKNTQNVYNTPVYEFPYLTGSKQILNIQKINLRIYMNTISRTKTLLLFLSLTVLTSCATIMHGTHQSVGIASNPSNATVWVDQMHVGHTPLFVELSRKDNHVVKIELEGYQPYEATFSRQLSGWVFGNIVFGGIIGLAVDAISGGLYMLTPDQVQAELRSNHMAYSKKSNDSCILVVLEPNPSWQKIGNLVSAN